MKFGNLKNLGCAAFLGAALIASPAVAEDQSVEDLARDGIENLMNAMELFVGSIPMYAAPEILPNGDIIIRRIQPNDDEGSGNDKQQGEGGVSDT